MPKKEYDNTNSGLIFINDAKVEELKKDEDDRNPKAEKWPDRKGFLDVNGEEFWVSGWIRECKSGKHEGEMMLSIKIEPKDEDSRGAKHAPKAQPAKKTDDDDEVPF